MDAIQQELSRLHSLALIGKLEHRVLADFLALIGQNQQLFLLQGLNIPLRDALEPVGVLGEHFQMFMRYMAEGRMQGKLHQSDVNTLAKVYKNLSLCVEGGVLN